MLRAILTCAVRPLLESWTRRGLLLSFPADSSLGRGAVLARPFIWVDDFVVFTNTVMGLQQVIVKLDTALTAFDQSLHPNKILSRAEYYIILNEKIEDLELHKKGNSQEAVTLSVPSLQILSKAENSIIFTRK